MRITLPYGRRQISLEVPDRNLVATHREAPAPALADPPAAVRDALEAPAGFPALRRALTPDDQVTVVADDRLPDLPGLLRPVLDHVSSAGVGPGAITVLTPAGSVPVAGDGWPEEYRRVRRVVHDPADRRQLSYLATTKHGRRLYLNRALVEADQVVVLSGRGYDPVLGYSGGAGLLFPAMSDEETWRGLATKLSAAAPGHTPWPAKREAAEVAWLLGAPFLVQVIEGAGDDVAHVLAGPVETSNEAERLLDARWRLTVGRPADTVVAAVSGDPARHTFADLARALACAARVVRAGGRIILLTDAAPALGRGAELLRQADGPARGLDQVRKEKPADVAAAFQWAGAAKHARIYLLGGLPAHVVEELFATPLDGPDQVRRLLAAGETCLFIEDAHKAMAVLQEARGQKEVGHG